MSILEKRTFIKKINPFSILNDAEIDEFINNLDIIYYPASEIIVSEKNIDKGLRYIHFIIKGVIHESLDNELVDIHYHDEIFGASHLIDDTLHNTFVAKTESICYIATKEYFLSFIEKHNTIKPYFDHSFSQKVQDYSSNERNKEFLVFMSSKVIDVFLHKPIIIDSSDSIYDGVKALVGDKNNSILVRDDQNNIGIVTNTDLREKAILSKMDLNSPINEITSYNLIYIDSDEFLFYAQIMMQEHNITKLVVKDIKEDKILGILDITSLISFFGFQSYVLDLELTKSKTINDLKITARSIETTIRVLFAKGMKINLISKMVSNFNTKLFSKLFELTCPKELKDKASLIVMGSEGREEQILKTDQDNALIIDDDCEIDDQTLKEFTYNFTEHLCSFGYARCDGNIMVSNPYWCRRISDFKDLIASFIKDRSEESLIHLAIFIDARCVNDNDSLLIELKDFMYSIIKDNMSFYESFALPVLNFKTPINFFENFVLDHKDHKDQLDIKKGGIFAIVHGIRALALEHHIDGLNTNHRIEQLQQKGYLRDSLAQELLEVFDFLLGLRLKFKLEDIDQNKDNGNYIKPSQLKILERHLLKDSFKVVNKFKKLLTVHYSLELHR